VIRRVEGTSWVTAVGAVVATVVAYWLPLFQVGGFVYTMIDSFGGRGQFVTAVALPIGIGAGALAARSWWPSATAPVALAAAVMVSLASVEHLGEAAWRREHPDLLGAPFEFRYGFAVASVGVVLGAIAFIVLLGSLLGESASKRDVGRRVSAGAAIAAIGLFGAVVGQVADSSSAHVWQLPRWPQTGRWWELLVTTAICGLAVWRRTPATLASALVVSIVAAGSEAQLLRAVMPLEDDPAVSSTVRLSGFAVAMVGFVVALVGALRSGSVVRRA
jgi:hypothetical protein